MIVPWSRAIRPLDGPTADQTMEDHWPGPGDAKEFYLRIFSAITTMGVISHDGIYGPGQGHDAPSWGQITP